MSRVWQTSMSETCDAMPAPEGDVTAQDTYGCPLDSKCKKHCQGLGFKDGKCEGATHLTCHCIG
ncbi:unnamed protein product [Medioppia subpectinata]|uniref:Defensin n=1 Tax=Medioppia subpectinata TaxID=1979941 RepID=A0A7R9L4T9_9ACAR|nr:unnamed protein product [Medioppia subpectinata]CAG2114381.1 unnamed protein product [Medioppia subpectinata]